MQKIKNVMVCVTQQKTCERLIKAGHDEIRNEKDNLYVIHVVSEKDHFLHNPSDGEALEYLFGVSKDSGADLTVIRAKDITKAMENFAVKKEINNIVMGASPNGDEFQENSITGRLKRKLSDVKFKII